MAEPVAIIGVNQSCGHQACESCVKRQLAQGQSHCTVCNVRQDTHMKERGVGGGGCEALTTLDVCNVREHAHERGVMFMIREEMAYFMGFISEETGRAEKCNVSIPL